MNGERRTAHNISVENLKRMKLIGRTRNYRIAFIKDVGLLLIR
jgi:hypothetical protein